MLVTFEGIPGAGKKAHIEGVRQKLEKAGFSPLLITTSEPGWNNEVSGILKYLALEGPSTPIEKLFLFLADRAGHFERFIRPILSQGQGYGINGKPIILCDGGPDSTMAYQGFGMGFPVPFIAEANSLAMQGTGINLTVVLDVSPEEALRRSPPHKRVKLEKLNPEFIHRVRKGYAEICRIEPERVITVNNMEDFEVVNEKIFDLIRSRLPTPAYRR